MMNTWVRVAAVVAAVPLAVGGAAVLGNGRGAVAAPTVKPVKMTFKVTPLEVNRPTVGKPMRLGDRTVTSARLTSGRLTGLLAQDCSVVHTGETEPGPIRIATWQCLAGVSLPGGDFTAQGMTTRLEAPDLIVTGGSGAYAGARGTLTRPYRAGRSIGDGTFDLTIRYRR